MDLNHEEEEEQLNQDERKGKARHRGNTFVGTPKAHYTSESLFCHK